MRKRILVFVLVALLLAGITALALANAPEELLPPEEILEPEEIAARQQEEAMDAAFDLLLAQEYELDEAAEQARDGRGELSLEEIDEARRELTHEWVSFFQTFGWERYDAFMYRDLDHLIEETKMSMFIIEGHIYWNQTGKWPTANVEEAEAFHALMEDRLRLNEEFLERVEEIQRSRSDYDIRALSGELEFMYFLSESQLELGARLQAIIDAG